jgi:hypothetical protein
VAEGEPLIVNVAWAAILATFSFSLSLVVWAGLLARLRSPRHPSIAPAASRCVCSPVCRLGIQLVSPPVVC